MSSHKRPRPSSRRSVRKGPKTSRHPGPGWKTAGRGSCPGLYGACTLDKHHSGQCLNGDEDE